jgi:hypothetical protein
MHSPSSPLTHLLANLIPPLLSNLIPPGFHHAGSSTTCCPLSPQHHEHLLHVVQSEFQQKTSPV